MAGKHQGKAPVRPRRAALPTTAQAQAQGIALADIAPATATAAMASVHAVDVPDTDDDGSLLAALASAGAFDALPESLDWASQQLLLDALADLEEAVAFADDTAFTPSSFVSSSSGSTSTRSFSGGDDEDDDEENEDDQEIVVSLSALRGVSGGVAPAKSPTKAAVHLTAQLPRPPVRPALAPPARPSATEETLPPNATRQDRNRLAARRTRERQKNRVMALEDEVRRGRQDRRQLLDRVEHLEARNKALTEDLTAAHRELDLLRRQLAKENAANNTRVPSDGADSLMDVVVTPSDEVVPDLHDGAAVVPTSSPASSSGESAAAATPAGTVAAAAAAAPCISAASTRPLAARTVQLLASWRLPVPPAALAGLLISAVVFLYTFGPLGVPAAVRPLALVKPSLQDIMRTNTDVPWATDGHRPLPPVAEAAPASPALAVPDWDWVRTDAAAIGGSTVDALEAALVADDLVHDVWTAAATEPAPMEEVEEDAGADDDAGEPASAGARRTPPTLLREEDPLPPRDLVGDAMLAEWLKQAVPTALPAIVHTLLLALQAKKQHGGAAGVVTPPPPVA